MTFCSTILLGVLLLGSPCGQADPEASPPEDRQADSDRSPEARRGPRERGERGRRRGFRGPRRGRDGGDRDEQRQRFRKQREAYRKATPQERREMRIDHWLDMTSMTYDLNEEQRQTVRTEMKAMADERRQEMGPLADEYERLHDDMMERFAKNMESGEPGPETWRRMRNDPELQRIRERMNEIETAYPFDFEAAGRRIEKLLPEDQVKKGRERIAEWQKRREEWQKRREERRRERERDGDREPGRRGGGNAASKAEAELRKAEADAAAERDRLAAEQAAEADAAVAARTAGPVHPWELYVREFIAKHKLTESQQTAAMAILKDSRQRATQYEKSVEKRKAEAEKIPDKEAREETLKKLSQPVEDLFAELKLRLDGLLTVSQRGDHIA